MKRVIDIDMGNFESEVLSFTGTAIIDFWAKWCVPCQELSKLLDELPDSIKIFKVDVDENQMLAQSFQVMSIPTVILVKNGETINRLVGLHDKKEYLKLIKDL